LRDTPLYRAWGHLTKVLQPEGRHMEFRHHSVFLIL
jgi:hypothetical protein